MDEHLIKNDISMRITNTFYIYDNGKGLLCGYKLIGEKAQLSRELFNFLGGTDIDIQGTYEGSYYIFLQTDLHLPILKKLTIKKILSHITGIFGLTPEEFDDRIKNTYRYFNYWKLRIV